MPPVNTYLRLLRYSPRGPVFRGFRRPVPAGKSGSFGRDFGHFRQSGWIPGDSSSRPRQSGARAPWAM